VSDRELLEAAARAAGIVGEYIENHDGGFYYVGCTHGILIVHDDGLTQVWNPLDDDGDALRLACALKINIEHAETLTRKAHGVNCWPVGRGDCGHIEEDLSDYNAATRRAIVRAAAALAPSTKEPA
jgi:hypothetical protein